ncbi:MAG: signal peptidase II [Verrucomicrobiota bacterium]|nr:signal peptidase II [Verrucomicrobiota bacterium]
MPGRAWLANGGALGQKTGSETMPSPAVNNVKILTIALLTLSLDQLTKWIVVQNLPFNGKPVVVVDGFFELVHFGNTGAAWSLFSGQNFWLAIFSLAALIFLWVSRRHFGAETALGQVALGLILGGVVGNLIDRVVHHHVVDFLQFYIPFQFPAFNVADSGICTGVGLMFVQSFQKPKPGATWAKKGKVPPEAHALVAPDEEESEA